LSACFTFGLKQLPYAGKLHLPLRNLGEKKNIE
jgi:hypothetical protein